ncbi:hypothetical protein M8C13_42090 [Crossiella sp. SN42]|uniref:hypothetical protein n=1 Tax=Crossiella sp. SN42 TaxID=2944808 RepID=UPI00207D0673|nr:hypothetical protein [Crossiella sp. SN42]MCO1582360.1 hypothetical protein [Crossiella sp. SN42]
MPGTDGPVPLFTGRATVLSEYGFFLIAAEERELPAPDDDAFCSPLKVCHPMRDAVYFLSYPSMQEVCCTVESWSAAPPMDDGEEPYDEQVEVDVLLTGEQCSVTGFEDYLTSIPVAVPGRQRMRVRVSGRAASKRLYQSDPRTNTDGLERWRIQFWPSPAV